MKFFWALTMIGSVIGGLILLWTIFTAEGAPQEAAGAAVAIAFAVLPYCFTRAMQLWDE